MNLEPLLTTKEVAELLKLDPRTVRGLRARGLVPLDLGRNFRYRAEDVTAFLERCAAEARRDAERDMEIPPFPRALEPAEATDKVLPFREIKREERNVGGH